MGRVAFPGTNEFKVFEAIRKREVNWPDDYETRNKLMSEEALDLFEKMTQLIPEQRLGGNSDMKDLKTHPYFNGIDFEEVSKPDYDGAKEFVELM